MPTIARGDSALHGIQLTAGVETTVDFERVPNAAEVVVTAPGAAPIYWTADGSVAAVAGADTRVIPAGVVAIDSAALVPQGQYPRTARVRLISAAAATVSVQRGA